MKTTIGELKNLHRDCGKVRLMFQDEAVFRNEVFASLEKVVDRLCDTICSLTPNTIFSITGRDWIIKAFN